MVSVVIPCYNQAHYLSEAIESVFAQGYPHVEIIVVDDGSGDATASVVARFENVVYIRQTNQGPSAARNTGLTASNGKYVVFLDADDRLLPHALATGQTCFILHPNSAFVYGRSRRINADGEALQQPPSPVPTRSDPYALFLEGNHVGMHATVMYRRDVLLAAGGFNAALRRCEEYEAFLRLAREHPVGRHETLIAEYRQHDGNSSHNAEKMLEAAVSILRAQLPHVRRSPRYRRSYRRGLRAWRHYYGELLVQEGGRALARRDYPAAHSAARAVWRLCGSRAPWVLLLSLVPRYVRSRLRRGRPHAAPAHSPTVT